ncbi:MAG TPA: class I SAM-dependent methyltransferase [Methanoregula sp.]|nr:class I SAM-dependent methyltransferase [Methanoregula sp.]
MAGEKRDFDTAAATWDENPRRVKTANDVAQAILATVPLDPAMDVLDFGCGTGLLTLALQPYVHAVTAVDNSRGMLEVLDKKVQKQGFCNIRTQPVDLEKGDTLTGQFDLVTSSMTFHHIKDVGLLLEKIYNVTKPGGTIAIADLDSDEGKFHDSNEGIFHFGFDRHMMKKYFEAAGFVAVRNRTAAIVQKTRPDGKIQTFTVFLMTGIKGE